MDKVGGSFGLFYGYVGIVGLVLYFVLRWFKAGVSLASVWCVYGECRRGTKAVQATRAVRGAVRGAVKGRGGCSADNHFCGQPVSAVPTRGPAISSLASRPPAPCWPSQLCPRLRAGGLHPHFSGLHRAPGERALGGGGRRHADIRHLHHAVAACAHPRRCWSKGEGWGRGGASCLATARSICN